MPSRECPNVINYFGGKYEVSKRLIPMMPEHDKYVEVFAGGLSMFFRKGKAKSNIVNDLNKDIANLYLVLSEPLLYEEFMHRAKWLIPSRTIYDVFRKDIQQDYKKFSIPCVARAVAYYFFIQNSFNSRVGTNFSSTSSWKKNMLSMLEWSRDKLEDVIVENMDYRKLIPKHIKTKKKAFWYVDPPYVITDKEAYYAFNFRMEEHEVMKRIMDTIDKAGQTFMISYDDVPYIRELYKDYNVTTIDFQYQTNQKMATELVIMNYEPSTQSNLF